MKVIYAKPPDKIYEKCHLAFGVNWEEGLAITYGDTVYSKYPLPPDLEAHEQVHIEQQEKFTKEIWWDWYLKSARFRLEQEIPAYKSQMAYIKKNYNRNKRRELEVRLPRDMARIYGGMCGLEEAKKILGL